MDFSIRVAIETILDELKNNGQAASGPQNVIVSPASLDILLRTAACGAKGKTLDQLLTFLGAQTIEDLNAKASSTMEVLRLAAPENNLPIPVENRSRYDSDDDYVPANVICANAIWVDRRFAVNGSFMRLLTDVYRAEAKNVDFLHQKDEAVKDINSWAEKSTNGCVDNILTPEDVNQHTPLVLTNAVYFKAIWSIRFWKSSTSDEDFHLLDGTNKVVTVPFMCAGGPCNYAYSNSDEFKVLELPYQTGHEPYSYSWGPRKKEYDGPHFSMYLFLPHRADGLPNLLRRFGGPNPSEAFSQTVGGLEYVMMNEIMIPKWKFACKLKPTETMRKLGLTLPFEMNGDFSGMLEDGIGELVYVSEVIQSAYIEVDEDGTEAGAVSALRPGVGCARYSPPKEEFIADHPFMFMIVERGSKAVIFAGAVFNPLDE